jgi:hypothetical protein
MFKRLKEAISKGLKKCIRKMSLNRKYFKRIKIKEPKRNSGVENGKSRSKMNTALETWGMPSHVTTYT